jgi:hypothetical protein
VKPPFKFFGKHITGTWNGGKSEVEKHCKGPDIVHVLISILIYHIKKSFLNPD